MSFELHPRLAADTHAVGDMALCRVLLMNDGRFPWLILVPRRAGARDVHRLDPADRVLLLDEAARAAAWLEDRFAADKMNVAALGNMVPQLHLHVIARRTDDAAWPNPVWGRGEAVPYADPAPLLAELRAALL
ncbi:MAG TPA: HIT domain-containing protein [Alphaproteobacteria bacterium]|nr:HIT domain-containing protein [Alphaproteobacteria bacterium]